ncbi:hypothetical protein SAMN05192544_112016, partial [Paraburkholderia hospita]
MLQAKPFNLQSLRCKKTNNIALSMYSSASMSAKATITPSPSIGAESAF